MTISEYETYGVSSSGGHQSGDSIYDLLDELDDIASDTLNAACGTPMGLPLADGEPLSRMMNCVRRWLEKQKPPRTPDGEQAADGDAAGMSVPMLIDRINLPLEALKSFENLEAGEG